MRAASAVSGLLDRIEGWIFAPGSARRLAAVRIGMCLAMAVRLSRPLYLQLAGQPKVLFRPISFMHAFGAMPPASIVLAIQVIAVAACVLGAAGLFVRLTLPVAFAGSMVLNGMWTSVGQAM